jgi:EREBP-like factor
MSVVETLAKWKENQTRPILKLQAIGLKKGCMKGKGGPENSKYNYRGVRQRAWGKWVTEIRQPKGGKRLWLGTFSNSMDAALAYDEAVRTMYGSCARLNFPDSCSATTSSSICPVETPAWFDSTNTSNNSDVFAVGDSTPVSPNLRNEDGESIAFVDIEAARATFAIEDIMHVSPNVMKEDEEGELRANTQHSVVADIKMPGSTI